MVYLGMIVLMLLPVIAIVIWISFYSKLLAISIFLLASIILGPILWTLKNKFFGSKNEIYV